MSESAESVMAELDKGVDISSVDGDGMSALFLAVQNKRPDIAELLLRRGADVNQLLRCR